MRTMKDRLSQRICELPDGFRNSYGTIEIDYSLAIPICAASLFIARRLFEENGEHPLALFAADRVEEVTNQIVSDENEQTVKISCDTDTLSFLRFSCEEVISNVDDFFKDAEIKSITEDRETMLSFLNQGAITLTAVIVMAMTSDS